ncbi:MAG: C40 family peptidase [Micrococcales bacterium]
MTPSIKRAWIGAGLALVLAVSVSYLAPAGATPNPVPSYPSAAEVAAAKKKVSTKKAMIARLEAIIVELTTKADSAERDAQIKGEAYSQAKAAYDAKAAQVATLQAQADAAQAQANSALKELGGIAAQMMRSGSGGTSLNLFLNSAKASNLLYMLGAQERLATNTNTLYTRAIAKQKYAQALTDELQAAKIQLNTRKIAAQTTYDAAQTAANTAIALVNQNQALNKTFYHQLAILQNTSDDLERQRAEGLAAERRQQQGSANMDAPELYTVGAPDTAKVATALAFMKAQLGEAYVLGGMGPNVWDCSGITKAGYAAAGIYIGTHSATNQFRTMAAGHKLIPLKDMQVGDLMWYTQSSAFDGDKYHVVVFVGGGMMLEAPNPARTVRIVPIRWGEMFPYAGRPSAP